MSQQHKDKMKARRIEQHSRVATYRFKDNGKYKGSKRPTDWYAFGLEWITKAFKSLNGN